VVQLLSDGYDRTRMLAGRLGQGDRLVEVSGRDAVWRDGRPHGLRYGSVTSMATSGALPTGLKLRMGMRYLPFLERHEGVLDLNAPARAVAAGLGGESIAEWGRRELGDDFVELLVYPLLAAYYGVTPEETSAALFHGLAAAGRKVRVLGIRGGAGALAEGMAASLRDRGVDFRTGAPVDRVSVTAEGVALSVAGASVEHDAAVVAVPPGEAARLVPAAGLSEIRTRSTATLVLATDGPTRTGWFGLSVPRSEPVGERIAAVCVQEEKGVGLGGPGSGALLVIPAPPEGERWAELDARAVLDVALPVDMHLPGTRGRVREARLVRVAGGFVPEPAHFRHVADLGSGLPSRLALAGDYLVSPTVEGAVRSGLAAAGRISRAVA
jgi:protoporphyrinogen oxidase